MNLFLTIDLEDWYHAHDYSIPTELWDECESRVTQNTMKLLDLLSQYNIKAVFFVLGYIANRHPELVKEISNQGHLIASHGYGHEKLFEIDKEMLKDDLQRSFQLLESITGKKVKHYRAPSWTYDKRTHYLHELLMDEGIMVDSSLQPFRTPLSGVHGAPLTPHYPTVNSGKSKVLEFPVTVCKIGPFRIPFCGGFYFRALPYWFIHKCLKYTIQQQDCFVYIHPWEIDYEQPKPHASFLIQLEHNYGIRGTIKKLEKLFQDFKFTDPKGFGVMVENEYTQ